MVWTRGGEGFGGEGECGDVVGPAEELAEVATQLRGAEEMDGRDAAALEVEKGFFSRCGLCTQRELMSYVTKALPMLEILILQGHIKHACLQLAAISRQSLKSNLL